ncbi:SMI1/KNR4 family protein [Sorangium sp. So ce363]|uniref:SMI1/KNR4 family protein n=1 Tax=Sorangium sp. So ce363 TaxID=3133304 RepID=UPI003F620CAD
MIRTHEAAKSVAGSDVETVEQQFGLALPDDYRKFLLIRNGGRPERDLVAVPMCEASPYARIHFFFGVGHPMECYDLAWNLANGSDLPAGLIPIATTEGADVFCLTPSGGVVFWDGYGGSIFPVSESFDQFLSQLYRDDLSPDFSNDAG